MEKKKYNIWDWVYSLIFPISFIMLVVSFGFWISGTNRNYLLISLILPTFIICGLTALHFVNFILGLLKKQTMFKANIFALIGLSLISTLFVSWTSSFRSAPELSCDFDIISFKAELQTEFTADSVAIIEMVLQEEPYFPKIVAPRIMILNPTIGAIDFKSLSTDTFQRFDNYDEIEEQLKLLGEPFAKKISQNCNMSGYNDVIIEFAKLSDDGQLHYRFINHYDNLLNN